MPRAVHVPFERGMKKRSINLIPFHRHQELLHLPSGRTKGHDVIREGRSEGGREGGKGTFQPTTTAAAAAPAAAAPAAAAALLSIALRGVLKGVKQKFVGCCWLRGPSLEGGGAV